MPTFTVHGEPKSKFQMMDAGENKTDISSFLFSTWKVEYDAGLLDANKALPCCYEGGGTIQPQETLTKLDIALYVCSE